MSSICLAMMVHNEAHLLQEVYDNIGSRLSSYCIIVHPDYDDDSVERAKELFGHLNGEVYKLPNLPRADQDRNQVLTKAQSMGDDYVLWMDPDSPFIGTIPDALDKEIYALLTLDIKPNISWWQPHIIRSDQKARWIGRIHEFLDCGQTPVQLLNTGYIRRDGSGGGRERWVNFDIPVLLEEYAERPRDPRVVNYLAQTFRDLGDYDNAIKFYLERVNLFGQDQETFYCFYMLGICSLLKNDKPSAEYWLLKAHAYRPSRAEPIERLIEIYQEKGEYILAMEMMKNLHTLPPTSDILLVQNRPGITYEHNSSN